MPKTIPSFLIDLTVSHNEVLADLGVVVLFVQIGALCSENPMHDKHLRFRHFRRSILFMQIGALRLQWPCELSTPRVSRYLPGQTSSLRSRLPRSARRERPAQRHRRLADPRPSVSLGHFMAFD